jgi:hypothetical protein
MNKKPVILTFVLAHLKEPTQIYMYHNIPLASAFNFARWLYLYAYYVIGDRWPEAEPYIMKRPFAALGYSRSVIKGRWVEAEPYIMKDPEDAFWYAYYVSGGR